VSERRTCALLGRSRRAIRYEPTGPDEGVLRQRLRAGGRVSPVRLSPPGLLAWRGRTSYPTARSCCASAAARKRCARVAVVVGNGLWAWAGRWCCPMARTSARASSLRCAPLFASYPSLTARCAADACASCAWRMTVCASDWRWCRYIPVRCTGGARELKSMALLRWLQGRRVARQSIAPGKPTQNGLAAPSFGFQRRFLYARVSYQF